MHGLHARIPKSFVLEERLERYAAAIEPSPERWRGRWAEACWPGLGAYTEGRGTGAHNAGRFSAVHLDLGCGKGSFTVEAARREPNVLFVGMDSEPICIAHAAQRACESGLANVVIVPGNGMRIREFFSAGELSCIYLNFPTPFPRKREAKKRMASMDRLMDFRAVLSDDGEVRLRTDSQPLFDFMLTQIPLAGYEVLWSSRDARAEAPRELTSEYEERLSARGAHVLALTTRPAPGPAPEHVEQTAELSLAAYLPHDLEGLEQLSYAPHGMESTVENLRNYAARRVARRS